MRLFPVIVLTMPLKGLINWWFTLFKRLAVHQLSVEHKSNKHNICCWGFPLTITVPQFVNFHWSFASNWSARKHSLEVAANDRIELHSVESWHVGACGGVLVTFTTAGAADGFRQELAGLGGASAAGFPLVLSVWYESDFPGFLVDFAPPVESGGCSRVWCSFLSQIEPSGFLCWHVLVPIQFFAIWPGVVQDRQAFPFAK